MDNRQAALVIARTRAVIGLVSLTLPGLVNRVFLGAGAVTPHAKALTRMTGVRDVALGVGALTSVKENTQGPEWLSMGAVADGVDALVSFTMRGAPRRTRWIGVFAAGAAAISLKLSRDLADARAAAARGESLEPGA
jgi:hypothetical protein